MTSSQPAKIAVAIVAAGRGERAGQAGDGPKQYRPIGGRAVLAHTVRALCDHPAVGAIAIAIHSDDRDLFEAAMGDLADRVVAVEGGASRQASVLCALRALRPQDPQFVMIHDGVRPFVDAVIVDRLAEGMDGTAGALPALPVSDTLKRVGVDGIIAGTEPRDGLFSAQTPQAFPFAAILQAHERAAETDPHRFTDDAALAEWAGIPVRVVAGSPENVKLTWAKDIDMADRKLAGATPFYPDVRTGTGYDVHGFTAGDHVTLCGVAIPHDVRLSGHSDADVGLHALTDALLATCSAGDIGTHFPPSDERWKGVDSAVFVDHAAGLVRENGGRIANVDVTVIAEAPKIGPHRQAMTARMAEILGIDAARISVKATTNEKLGFVGRREGIAALATATVIFSGEVPS
ncbi:MAG: bifunctional 2-C-methyl-D-erythritol 4-phosphate cytidylyltransferase/2-C-methyl-D-erythritol 2,4-cyclodiphosphate synthase [Rhizobiaceae bacterium]